MIVRKMEDEDFAQVIAWAKERGDDYTEEQLPSVGFIVDGIAAYFIYQTDSSVCWLENLISKKGTDKFIRSRAIDLLLEAAIKEATDLGFTVAYALTDLNSVAKRARSYGAFIKPLQILITKDLTGKNQLQ